MNWYKGNIAEAVAMSKTKNAIFVVYIEGKDEMTQKLTKFINETKIKNKLESDDFVAIKIESDSQAYLQFAKIYQVVPVPSIFFIGHAGTPLDVGTGIMSTSEELEQKIEKVLVEAGKNGNIAASSSSSLISAERSAVEQTIALGAASATTSKMSTETHDVVCEGDVCRKVPKKEDEETPAVVAAAAAEKSQEQPSKDAAPPAASGEDLNARVEETRKLLEQKRRERIEAEKQQEKEEELRRRREGKEMQHMQSWQKDQELKELKENIRRERLEEQTARERIRAQIAADRAERAEKNAQDQYKASASATIKPTASPPQPTSSTDSARLQFRLSTGENKTEIFNCHDTLSIVRSFVQSELIAGTGIRDFILATNYPKREFSAEDDERTLVELDLFPSAVILVIVREGRASPSRIIARSGGIVNIVTTLFWALMSPIVAVYGYIRNMATPKNSADDNAAGSQTGAQKRANEEQTAQEDAAKRRFLDRFANGPSTSSQSSPTSHQTQDNDAKPYRRYVGGSNIHRLTDQRKDSDDENATWNGNSTQQQ